MNPRCPGGRCPISTFCFPISALAVGVSAFNFNFLLSAFPLVAVCKATPPPNAAPAVQTASPPGTATNPKGVGSLLCTLPAFSEQILPHGMQIRAAPVAVRQDRRPSGRGG